MHLVSFWGRFWNDFERFFINCWTTARKCPFFKNRCPSAAVCLFLSSFRHAVSSLFLAFSVTRAGECFRRRFYRFRTPFGGRFWTKNRCKTMSKNEAGKDSQQNSKKTCLSVGMGSALTLDKMSKKYKSKP